MKYILFALRIAIKFTENHILKGKLANPKEKQQLLFWATNYSN